MARPALARLPLAVGASLLIAVSIGIAACSSAGSPASAPGSAGPVVAISAYEYAFDPDHVDVEAGEVTFSVTNTGTVEHEFEILDGDRVVDEVEGLVPGVTRQLTVDLEPGTYTYVCQLAGHQQAGMQGTLTVSER